jgi:hypothetical protein
VKLELNQRVLVDWAPVSVCRETVDNSERRNQIYGNNVSKVRLSNYTTVMVLWGTGGIASTLS